MLHALCRAPLLQQQLAVLLKQTVGVLPLLSQGVGGTLASPPRRRQIACAFWWECRTKLLLGRSW